MINLNECKFGDKLKISNGEMGIYAGWYYPLVENPNNDDFIEYIPSEDKLHYIIINHGTSFGIEQVYDYGSLYGDITVIGRWEE